MLSGWLMIISEPKTNYRVCIPAAGLGTRLAGLTSTLCKPLVTLSHKPIITRIIEQFPEEAEFVIAIGYKGELLKEFLLFAYPNRKFHFCNVENYCGPGSGLGLSLLACKEYLQMPFTFISSDTLVSGVIKEPTHNWMGFSYRDNCTSYRTIVMKKDEVVSINEKAKKEPADSTGNAYIGLAGINDYEFFWRCLETGGTRAIIEGESYALKQFLDASKTITAYPFEWNDVGNIFSLGESELQYKPEIEVNILPKEGEAIWFLGKEVIKFSDDPKFIKNRVMRVASLQEYVPSVVKASEHFYAYHKIEGEVFSAISTLSGFKKLLDFSSNFWEKKFLQKKEMIEFRCLCDSFYRIKTINRIAQFYDLFEVLDKPEIINDTLTPSLSSILDLVDWAILSDGIPGRFHGDFHFENIIVSENYKFKFIDWRQDFNGSLDVGDIYYDLAKLLHGLIVSHTVISNNQFSIVVDGDNIKYDFHRIQSLIDCQEYFGGWLGENGYDKRRVRLLCSLIFLNIAPLHHQPYNLFLYYLGKKMLYESVKTCIEW